MNEPPTCKNTESWRPAVCAVFSDSQGLVLICERADTPGIWQFPQGGIESGESPEQALAREVLEELGVRKFAITAKGARTVPYRWPQADDKGRVGQDMHWFRCRFTEGTVPDFSSSDGSFTASRWVSPGEALAGIVEWKRGAVAQGLALIGISAAI